MARSMDEDNVNVFRLKKVRTHEDGSVNYSRYEGPYTTIGAARARKAWNKGFDELIVQQLVATGVHMGNGIVVPKLVWEDIDE